MCSEDLGLCEAPVEVLEEQGVLQELEANDLGQPSFFDDGETLGEGCSQSTQGQTGLALVLLMLAGLLGAAKVRSRKRAAVRIESNSGSRTR